MYDVIVLSYFILDVYILTSSILTLVYNILILGIELYYSLSASPNWLTQNPGSITDCTYYAFGLFDELLVIVLEDSYLLQPN